MRFAEKSCNFVEKICGLKKIVVICKKKVALMRHSIFLTQCQDQFNRALKRDHQIGSILFLYFLCKKIRLKIAYVQYTVKKK